MKISKAPLPPDDVTFGKMSVRLRKILRSRPRQRRIRRVFLFAYSRQGTEVQRAFRGRFFMYSPDFELSNVFQIQFAILSLMSRRNFNKSNGKNAKPVKSSFFVVKTSENFGLNSMHQNQVQSRQYRLKTENKNQGKELSMESCLVASL